MNLRLSLAGAGVCLKGHPWIASDAQLSYRRPPGAGAVLKVQDSQGDFLGWAVSEGPSRKPAFRVLSRERHADFGAAWWQGVVERALARRGGIFAGLDAAPRRLLDSEADGAPGLLAESCAGQIFLSSTSPALEPFLPLIEQALVDQTRARGLWRRLMGDQGAWGPWHRSPLAPLSLARFTAEEGGLRVDLDLGEDAAGLVPPWPLDRRSWRDWARENCAGQTVLALGALDGGEADAARSVGPARLERKATGFADGLNLGKDFRAERLIVDLPAKANAAFGRFDAAKHAPKLLQGLRALAAEGAQWLVSSDHPSLAGAEAWGNAWEKAGVAATLVRALGPEPDCPELPRFPEGRRRRAFVFGT
ncbi:MAG: hypothetical protein ACREKE_04835 [bacterium]